MTDNFDHQDHDHTDDFVEHEGGEHSAVPRDGIRGNLAEAWRTQPMFKFTALVVAVIAVGVAAVNFFGGSNGPNDIAHLARPPSMKEAPGGAVSPYMRQQTEEANSERTKNAEMSGGSAIPTPIGQPSDTGVIPQQEKKDDILNELKGQIEQLKQQQQVQQVQAQQVQAQQQQQQRQPEQFDNSLAEAMQHQMQQLLDGWQPKGIKTATVVKIEDLKEAEKKNEAVAAAAGVPATPAPVIKNIVNAGTVSYAQLLTEANSDVPGPIMAQIVSGPLAGARAIGSFQEATGYEKYLVLHFTIADRKGKDYAINAYALDPSTTLGGMATEVDERYFARVVLPAAAGFLQGMGQALGQGNSSVTTNGTTSIASTTSNGYKQGIYNGMGQAAQTMGQFFQDQANLTKPLVRVASGTAMGMFFVAPVKDETLDEANAAQGNGQNQVGVNGGYSGFNQGGYGQSGYGQAGYNQGAYGQNPYGVANGGYPGTTVSGYGAANGLQNSGAPYPNYATPGTGYYNRGQTQYGAGVYQGNGAFGQ